jgi:hypothetical protein
MSGDAGSVLPHGPSDTCAGILVTTPPQITDANVEPSAVTMVLPESDSWVKCLPPEPPPPKLHMDNIFDLEKMLKCLPLEDREAFA